MKRVSSYSCAFKGCQNSRGNSSVLSFYGFPVKDIVRCKKWIINTGNPVLIQNIDNVDFVKSLKLCEKHFEKESFYDFRATRKTLLKSAIPVKYMEETVTGE